MSLDVERNFVVGVPKTRLLGGLRPTGICDHWTAGRPGRAGAEATIRHFVNTRGTVNASYHLLTWWVVATKTLHAMWIVESDWAAHSVNPRLAFVHSSDPARRTREAARFAEARRILAGDAGDPNAGMIARSFCGMPADLKAALTHPEFITAYAELTRQLLAAYPTIVDRPMFGHGWLQPSNRYEMDAGPGGIDLLISAIYKRLAQPAEEDDMPTPPLTYLPELWKAGDKGADLREQAHLDAPVVGHIEPGTPIFTVGASKDNLWRLALAGDPEKLLWVRKPVLVAATDPVPDPALYAGIAAVVNARLEGKPVASGDGVPVEEVHDALLDMRSRTIAAYTSGGTERAQAVSP